MKRLHTVLSIFATTLCLASLVSTTQAAIVYSGDLDPANPNDWTSSTTAYIGNTDTTSPGQVEVNGGSDLLSRYAYLGYNSGTSGTVTVTDTGSTWTNHYSLIAGYDGSGTLAITDGGIVNSGYGHIGYNSGSTGTVTVDGAGSTWTSGYSLFAGYDGSGTLAITDGGIVGSSFGYIGYNSGSIGIVTVDGVGSTWTVDRLYVGKEGNGTLNITNGGTVNVTSNTYVAYDDNSTGSINFGTSGGTLTTTSFIASSAQLTGTGVINTNSIVSDYDLVFDSTHDLVQTLTIGDSGQGRNITVNLNMNDPANNLGVNHGSMTINGIAVNSKFGHVGYYSGSTGVVTVDGAGSTWNNSNNLTIGRSGSGTLTITNGGTVSNTDGDIGSRLGSTGSVTVEGTGSTWTNSSDLYVGNYGSGTLTITNGGTVTVNGDYSDSYIGYYFDSNGAVTVDGAGSTWTNSGDLIIGCYGDGTLNITNGGTVNVDNYTYVACLYDGRYGCSTGSINFGTNGGTLTTKSITASSAQLTGTGVINTNGIVSDYDLVFDSTHGLEQTLTIGGSGQDRNITVNLDKSGSVGDLGVNHGSMTINEIAVYSQHGYIGYFSGSTGVVTVDGAGASWNNSDNLYVGRCGNGTLTITNGGTVNAIGYHSDSYVGCYSGSTGVVTVDGAGSTWNSGDLQVGNGTVSVINGGTVRSGFSYISGSGSNGIVTVDGVGSTWTNDGLHINSGTLSITGGGSVVNYRFGYIGDESGLTGVVNVDGTGSSWTNRNHLYVGHSGSGTMTITDGGTVRNDDGYVGCDSGSTGVVTVDGAGSTWTNKNDLYISDYISNFGDGTLNITNGGTVNVHGKTYVNYNGNSTGSINFGDHGGTLTTGSLVAMSTQLFGTGTINTNGIVSDYDLVFDSPHGLNQTLTIGGSGQDRNITVNLDMSSSVGDLGVNNGSMTINGIAVHSINGYVGRYFGSTGIVTVDGVGSAWANSDYLAVGNHGSGMLSITNGGSVSNDDCYIAGNAGLTSAVIVDGAGSTWTNRSYLRVGGSGTGTLTITNGGAVSSQYGRIASSSGSIGVVTVDGAGSTWTNSSHLWVGSSSSGTLTITNGGAVSSNNSNIASSYGSTSGATVDGVGSTWTNSGKLLVGLDGNGTLSITGGGAVSNNEGYIGYNSGSIGIVMVDDTDSTWTNTDDLYVGYRGSGTLTITNGGLVSVAGTLTIDNDTDGDGFLNMSDGGILALAGDADDSLAAFFNLINGTDAIQWWDPAVDEWNSLTTATIGEDYTLEYFDSGDWDGYTILTVGTIPEPGSFMLLLTLLATALTITIKRRR